MTIYEEMYPHITILRLVLGTFVLMTMLLGPVIGGMLVVKGIACHATADAMHVSSTYSIWTDCMITVDGKTMPLSSYKVVGVQQ
jgi:hypothetical protein